MNIRDAYEDSLRREGHVRDTAQMSVIDRLEELQLRLTRQQSFGRMLLNLVTRSKHQTRERARVVHVVKEFLD